METNKRKVIKKIRVEDKYLSPNSVCSKCSKQIETGKGLCQACFIKKLKGEK